MVVLVGWKVACYVPVGHSRDPLVILTVAALWHKCKYRSFFCQLDFRPILSVNYEDVLIITHGIHMEIGWDINNKKDPYGFFLFPHHTAGVLALWQTSKNIECVCVCE